MTEIARTLESVCLRIVDCEHKTAPVDIDGEFFAVGTPAMRGHRINLGEARRISADTFAAWTRRMLPEAGDLLFAREAPVGPIVRIPKTGSIAPGQRTVLMRPDPDQVDSQYLYYLFTSPRIQAEVQIKAEGSTVPHLNVADVRAFELPPLPPIAEQRAIAMTLRALDDKIESNRRAIEAGERLLRSKVQLAIDSSSGDEAVLSDYCGLVKATVGAESIDPAANYIGFEHMPRGSVFLNDWTTAEGLGSHKTAFRAGDVLFGKLRPYFKKVGIAPVDGVCSTDILVIRPKNPRDQGLITCIAASDALIDSLSASSTGTRMPRASWNDLASWPVPKMTEAELASLADDVSPLIARLEALTFESQRLAELRDVLLPELLSGRIRVPVDETV